METNKITMETNQNLTIRQMNEKYKREAKLLSAEDLHIRNHIGVKDLEKITSYIYHNISARDSYTIQRPYTKEECAEILDRYNWPLTTVIHGDDRYDFYIIAIWNGKRLQLKRNVFKNLVKTNARVLRSLLSRHYASDEYINQINKFPYVLKSCLPLWETDEECNFDLVKPKVVHVKPIGTKHFWVNGEIYKSSEIKTIALDIHFAKFNIKFCNYNETLLQAPDGQYIIRRDYQWNPVKSVNRGLVIGNGEKDYRGVSNEIAQEYLANGFKREYRALAPKRIAS